MRRYGHDIKLWQVLADEDGNDEHQDRIVCTHIFHGQALPDPAGKGGTMTIENDPEQKVWPWQMCSVCRGFWFGT
jgi:hypothetical protein